MSILVSGRVRKTPQSGITSDRYQFLGLEQSEPDLGDPLVGPSSIAANPVPVGDKYILVNVGGQTGKRYWLPSTQLPVGGLSPGSFTVFANNVQVGLANSFNVFNFVGNGVSVDPVSSNPNEQTGIATVRIQVTDVVGPGNPYEIPYNDPSTGFLRGATNVVFRSNNVGIGSTIPTQKLDVLGNANISGQVGVNTLVAGFVTATNSYFGISTAITANITNLQVGVGATSIRTNNGNVGIGSTLPQYKLDVTGSVKATQFLESPGIVTTTSTSVAVLDSFNTSQYRSARYKLQITTTNQLRLGTGSVSNLFGGTGYTSGTYDNISLISSGIGTGAKATIIVDGGGSVLSVSLTNSGSGYQVGEIITVNNSFTGPVGSGFSFTTAGPLIESFQISDVLLLQSVGSASTDAYVIEYAGISNYDSLGDYSADVNGSSARLKFTPNYAYNTIKFTRSGTDL